MKLLHISDLHLGKRVKGYSLIEDQKFILAQILDVCTSQKVNGIIIAGDLYDLSVPSAEAVSVFDKFISDIHLLGLSCFAVSGNHDSISRISFGSDIMSKENIYFAKKYSGELKPIEIDKNICIWLLPFIRPIDAREFYPDIENCNYEDMMKEVIKNANIDTKKTNILVAHQFITNNGTSPERSESETVSLGTLDNIDYTIFRDFDYVALGHIHKPQSIGRKTVRYSGSPIKYSFSEKNDKKSMVLINIDNKDIQLEFIPFKPIRDMKEYVGTYSELSLLPKTDDYTRIVLKDENYITDVKQKLEGTFSNIMEIVYDNTFTRENKSVTRANIVKQSSPPELFETFFKNQNNRTMNKEERKIIEDIFRELEGAE